MRLLCDGLGAARRCSCPAQRHTCNGKTLLALDVSLGAGVTIAKRVLSHFESSETRLSGTHTRSPAAAHPATCAAGVSELSSVEHTNQRLSGATFQ